MGVAGVQSKDLAHTQKGVSLGFAAIYGKHPQVDSPLNAYALNAYVRCVCVRECCVVVRMCTLAIEYVLLL